MTKSNLANESEKNCDFTQAILDWFDNHGRKDLPWQHNITPYRVWISEIMLQQTQVVTVIPYFNRFITRFPTLESLAQGQLDEVLQLWSGLGYYARARNLHKSAIIAYQDFQGELPADFDSLITLPGIGRSTAGAILSIAYHIATPILDGNVKRVLTRYYAIAGHLSEIIVANQLWQLATQHTSHTRCADYTQAIMDLGATLCTRSQPNCNHCPIQKSCEAYQRNQVAIFPNRRKKAPLPIKETQFLILINDKEELLLQKRPSTGIWGGLWSFPECAKTDDPIRYAKQHFHCTAKTTVTKATIRHTFSHFHLDITPVYMQVKFLGVMDNIGLQWCQPQQLPKIGIAAPIKKLLLTLTQSL